MMLTDLATVLREAGLRVVERPGWKSAGHGPMTDVKGVTCHHTASGRGTGLTLGMSTVEDGRPGLDGPLAHLYLNREGTFYTIAAGLCYHAGISRKPSYTNAHRIGIEALAAGDGWSRDWPPAQMAAYARGTAALANHYGFPISEIRGHKETCEPEGRKIDPDFSMTGLRSVATTELALIRKGVEDTTMEKTDRLTLGESAAKELGKTEKDTITVEYALLWGGARGAQLRGDNVRMSKQIAGLQASVNALATAVKAVTAGSPQAVTDAFDAGVARLRDELADIDVRISLGDDETTS